MCHKNNVKHCLFVQHNRQVSINLLSVYLILQYSKLTLQFNFNNVFQLNLNNFITSLFDKPVFFVCVFTSF